MPLPQALTVTHPALLHTTAVISADARGTGRKIANPTKGLYIVNGKKVVKY